MIKFDEKVNNMLLDSSFWCHTKETRPGQINSFPLLRLPLTSTCRNVNEGGWNYKITRRETENNPLVIGDVMSLATSTCKTVHSSGKDETQVGCKGTRIKVRERGGLAWASSRHGGRVPRDPGWNAGRSYRVIVSQGPHSIRSAALLVETVTNSAQNVGVEPAVLIKEGSRSHSLRGKKWVCYERHCCGHLWKL